jgi:hypothetical protein
LATGWQNCFAFAPKGLCLDRLCSMNNPGQVIVFIGRVRFYQAAA